MQLTNQTKPQLLCSTHITHNPMFSCRLLGPSLFRSFYPYRFYSNHYGNNGDSSSSLSSSSSTIPKYAWQKKFNDKSIIWMDLEMTGLDLERDHILEVACLVTDEQLRFYDRGLSLVIHQPDSILSQMNSWCLTNHSKSGLIGDSRESRISVREADAILLQYLQSWTSPRVCPLGGSSVHVDRRFLERFFPLTHDHLNHRNVDVSTVSILVDRWYSNESFAFPRSRGRHRAMDDLYDSISRLIFIRKEFFRNNKDN